MMIGIAIAIASALSTSSFAQSPLPSVTVEGKTPKAKKSAPKAAPAAVAPVAPPPAPAKIESTAERDKARLDATYETPASVSTAGKSELDTFGSITTGDVLRAMPGTFTRDSPQTPGLAINIRGFEGSGRVTMMIDGVRQNFRFTGHEAQGFTYVDPALLAGVDVFRGALSTVGGAGSLAGAANLRTLDVHDIVKPGNTVGVLSSLTYGTNGIGWKEMLAAGMTNDAVGVAGAISHSEPGNYKNADGVTVPFTGRDITSALFKLNFALSPEHTIKFGAMSYEAEFLANSYFQTLENNIFTVNYRYAPISTTMVDLRVNAYASHTEMRYSTTVTGGGAAAGRIIDDEGRGFDISNTSRFKIGAVRIRSDYGIEYFENDVHVLNSTAVPNRGVNPSGQSSIGGLFSQTTFSYAMVDLIAGLRYDRFTINGTGSVRSPNPMGMPAGFYTVDRDEGHFSPKITLALNPTPWLKPYVTYSESFRAPTISETLTGGTHPATGGPAQSFFPNPFLEPEFQKGWEFGFNVKSDGVLFPKDSFRLKVAYFTMDVENYVTANFVGGTHFYNVPGVSTVHGVELQGLYDAGIFYAGLSYTNTETDLPSQVNGFGSHSYLPEHMLVATGGLRFFDQKLVLGGRVSYFSESDVGLDNVGGFYASQFMPGYTLVDVFSSYKFDQGIELGVTATNVFDVGYTPALTTPLVGATCFGSNLPNCNDIGRGRTVMFTARAHF